MWERAKDQPPEDTMTHKNMLMRNWMIPGRSCAPTWSGPFVVGSMETDDWDHTIWTHLLRRALYKPFFIENDGYHVNPGSCAKNHQKRIYKSKEGKGSRINSLNSETP